MQDPVPISVVILTKNEEDRLTECLESVRWAGEVLVVDDESTDRTVDLARSWGARVIKRRMDVEGSHRNWAYAQARYDWILSLDADERVTPELAEEIATLLKSGEPACDIYAIPRRNHIGSRWVRYGGWYPSPQVKLFRKDRFAWEETTVHPRAISKSDKPWGQLRNDLDHHSYRDLTDFMRKLNRQTSLEAEKWIRDGRRMSCGKALWRSWDRFVRSYVNKQGYREGVLGFILAVLAGMYQFLSWAKYWHKIHPHPPEPFPTPLASFDQTLQPSGSFQKRERITAVVLTRNEAHQIRECLDTIRWVDEVVVIDGESTDGTPQICEDYGAKVITHRFEGDFSKERNLGIQYATGDWILQLDADDRITEPFRRAVLKILESHSPYVAYRFRRRNCFLGHWMRHGGWEHYSAHLFRRGKAWYRGRVHETLEADGPIGVLEESVDHLPFRSLEQFIEKQNRYTGLFALDMAQAYPHAGGRWWWVRHLAIEPAKRFWKFYIKKQGWREGRLGFIFCGLYAFVYFLTWAKVWELKAHATSH